MKRIAPLVAASLAAMLLAGCGHRAASEWASVSVESGGFGVQTGRDALPEGHPPIEEYDRALPEGHPPVPGYQPGLPEGHPVCPAGQEMLERDRADDWQPTDDVPPLIST